ncbi:MAG: prolyl oligopeptidase family serine peptidase [Lentisphaerae bacterium]|nr:prolyl oligopeptidase family serine peptidase [Lentisphaerota bacterium]MBT4822187.1 prolyl oligopeptidase family serine peptidase [Lentisphaerota bacterium]MBT5610377.1 prolyl oligopeptidase family serine peptidase [Lentisphaerota bacterium]MBT7056205.1 prolyl oligopeptidase family serine peptidase [Lentisphaerota bacterium]MBT7841873.1 prolyl oligopeptidase family serine peptidase [Lentisphaerota bacterium]
MDVYHLRQTVFIVALWSACGCVAQAPPPVPGSSSRSGKDLQKALAELGGSDLDRETLSYRTNVPLARLALRKAALGQRSRRGGQSKMAGFVADGFAALDRLAAQKPFLAPKGELTECAYVTENDGTAQPYFLYLPPSYDPDTPTPMVVFLHGWVPTTSLLDPWTLGPEICAVAGKHGCMLLIPYGRRNTDFQGVGEVDVLASTEHVQSIYAVDSERIIMSGVSMGGMGAWNMALRHPGLYAACAPITGQTDMHAWWPRVLRDWPRNRDDLFPFRRFMVEWDNPIDLVMNARNQSMFIQHGEHDSLIPVEHSRRMVSAARELGFAIKIFEFKGQNHYIYWDTPCFENAWSWAVKQRLNRSPERVTYKTYSLEYDTSFWVRIAGFARWGVPASVDCRVSEGGTGIEVTAENVATLMIDTKQAPLTGKGPWPVVANGVKTHAAADADGFLHIDLVALQAPVPGLWPPAKRKGLCGPIEEVFDGPFMVVLGTGGTTAEVSGNLANVRRWLGEWDGFADGMPSAKRDSAVTDEEIAGHNLVLFGTPASNTVLRRMADKLPIRIGDHEYEVAGKTYKGDDLGLVMCYPNPLAPNRYITIYAGELYGGKCGVNHKHDLLPDFIVFRKDTFSFDDTNEHRVAGFFNTAWQLDSDLTWVGRSPGK